MLKLTLVRYGLAIRTIILGWGYQKEKDWRTLKKK